MQVLDNSTGQWVDVDESTATQGYLAGRYRFEAGAQIPVVDDAGRLGSVAAEDAASVLGKGYAVANADAYAAADREARYGSAGQVALTAAEGAGRGLTLGLSEGALGLALGPEYAEAAKAREQANPIASIGGEVAGALAPAVLSGGASAEASGASLLGRAGRALTTAPRLAARGGAAVEAAAARALGEGTTALGRIGRTALAKGAGAAAEQLPSAIGHGVSTALLDRDATAERILAQVGLETMAGGFAGGILGGVGKAGSEAYQSIARRVFGDATHPALGEALVKLSSTLSGDDAGALSRLALGDAGEGLLSASARANRALAFGAKAREETAKELVESLASTRESLAAVKAAAAREPSAVATGALEAIARADNAEARLANARLLDPERGASGEGVRRYLSQLVDPKADPTHGAIGDWLKAGDALASVEAPAKSELGKAIADYRSAAARANAAAGKASDAVVLANQARELTRSTGGQDGVIGLGAMASLALDSAVPLAGGAALNAARSAVSALRSPGTALERLAAVERLVQGVSDRLDGGLGKYLDRVRTGVVKGASAGAKAASSAAVRSSAASARRTYERTRERLEAAANDPRGLDAALARSTRHVAADAPEVAAAVRERTARANAYLEANMPRAQQSGPWTRREPSAAELARFARVVSAVEDPVGALTDELERGTLSADTLKAIREVYPTLAAQITARVAEGVAAMPDPPPYGERVRLSLLLGQPLDPSMRPEAIAAMQLIYATPEPPPPTRDGNMRGVADSYQTSAERATE